MDIPRIFVSSTAHDLSDARDSLRSAITGLGYMPILSEYGDFLFDPKQHTHLNCLKAVEGADIIVLILSGRFGSPATPDAINYILRDNTIVLDGLMASPGSGIRISVTQAEALKALASSIPMFTFVDQNVMADYQTYLMNRQGDSPPPIAFASIEDQTTAANLFEFIRYIQERRTNNVTLPYKSVSEISSLLTRQLAFYFQQLLNESRMRTAQESQTQSITNTLEDLKSAIIASIPSKDVRSIARGVVRYRHLYGFLSILPGFMVSDVEQYPAQLDLVLRKLDFRNLITRHAGDGDLEKFILKKADGGGIFFEPKFTYADLEKDWSTFRTLDEESRNVIFESLSEESKVGIDGPWNLHATGVDQLMESWRATGRMSNRILLAPEERTGGMTVMRFLDDSDGSALGTIEL